MGDSDMFITSPSILTPLNHPEKWEVWVYWWEAVVHLNQSLPLSLLTMRAGAWRRMMGGATTVHEVTLLPGATRRVFTRQNWVVRPKTKDTLGQARHLPPGRSTRARRLLLCSKPASAAHPSTLHFGSALAWTQNQTHLTLVGEVSSSFLLLFPLSHQVRATVNVVLPWVPYITLAWPPAPGGTAPSLPPSSPQSSPHPPQSSGWPTSMGSSTQAPQFPTIEGVFPEYWQSRSETAAATEVRQLQSRLLISRTWLCCRQGGEGSLEERKRTILMPTPPGAQS